MSNQFMLDCTLRDGGWVNQFCFGTELMNSILHTIETSGIEYVELGYLDEKKGSPKGRSEYSNLDAVQNNCLLEQKNPKVIYLVMIDYGKYPVELLPVHKTEGIDGIRLCFHKKDAKRAIQMGQEILKKGYQLFMQPMVSTRYTDSEFAELMVQAQENLKGVRAFYIVDSFGSMEPKEVAERMRLADGILREEICLGLHTHNNMQCSFQNCAAALELGLKRDMIIDGTLSGIGKGAGNMNTEIFAGYLNQSFGKRYQIDSLKQQASHVGTSMRQETVQGFRTEYYLSAKYHLTPSYAENFFRRGCQDMEELEELLAQVPEEKKDSFDKDTVEKILQGKINSKECCIP